MSETETDVSGQGGEREAAYDPDGLSMPENLDRYVENLRLISDRSRDGDPAWVAMVDLVDATLPDLPVVDVLRLANVLVPATPPEPHGGTQ